MLYFAITCCTLYTTNVYVDRWALIRPLQLKNSYCYYYYHIIMIIMIIMIIIVKKRRKKKIKMSSNRWGGGGEREREKTSFSVFVFECCGIVIVLVYHCWLTIYFFLFISYVDSITNRLRGWIWWNKFNSLSKYQVFPENDKIQYGRRPMTS